MSTHQAADAQVWIHTKEWSNDRRRIIWSSRWQKGLFQVFISICQSILKRPLNDNPWWNANTGGIEAEWNKGNEKSNHKSHSKDRYRHNDLFWSKDQNKLLQHEQKNRHWSFYIRNPRLCTRSWLNFSLHSAPTCTPIYRLIPMIFPN